MHCNERSPENRASMRDFGVVTARRHGKLIWLPVWIDLNFKFERLIWQKPSDRSFHRPLLDYGIVWMHRRLTEADWKVAKWNLSYKDDTIPPLSQFYPSFCTFPSVKKKKIFIWSGKILGIFSLSLLLSLSNSSSDGGTMGGGVFFIRYPRLVEGKVFLK